MTTPALSTILPREMAEFRFRPLFIFVIDVAKPSIIGKTPGVERRVGEITGGRFDGERLKGKIRVDLDTARRLFTLICALHWKG